MLPLKCKAQNYEWGRPFSSSEVSLLDNPTAESILFLTPRFDRQVAQLAKANGNDIDESKPFAELW